ncbi:hypothetical protein, partial [Serratia marcescens]|uniref:hypothetical protein n=1 Tax=Serratia marcescens TaxID=615 RepID=UPI002812FE70
TALKCKSLIMLKYMKELIVIEQVARPKAMMNDVLILSRLAEMLEEVEIKLNRLNELGSWCPENNLKFDKSEFSQLF